jgi:sugar lactone lactonase YvrE
METSKVQRLTVSEPFLRLGSLLAEGPFYRSEDDTFHFVDIRGKLLYRVPLSGSSPPRALSTEDMLGVACLIEEDNDNYIVAAKRGFALLNQESGALKYLANVFPDAEMEKRYLSLLICRGLTVLD